MGKERKTRTMKSKYKYKDQRDRLFTDDGQKDFLRTRDDANILLAKAGAFRADKVWQVNTGDNWLVWACLDRMVELDELKELTPPETLDQYRVFTRAYSKEKGLQ